MVQQLLGIDIGTSSVKALICQANGQVLARAERKHDLRSPRPGWAEESPTDWWNNTIGVLGELLADPAVSADQVAAVGTTGMLPAVLVLDGNGNPLRPSIQQNDARATAEIETLRNAIDPDRFFEMTGASINQQSVGPKLLWLQSHEPEVWSKTRTVLGSYDYINFRFTGVLNVEANWALESGLFDLNQHEWSPELLTLVNTPPSYMPNIHSPSEVIGTITPKVASETGLRAGTPVVAGTADHVGAAFAAGIKEDGDLLIKFGSAGDVLYSCDRLIVDPRLYIDYHDIPDKFLLNGCMATSGSLVKWVVEEFFQADRATAKEMGLHLYEYLDDQAAGLPAGSEGLIVLPYFLGEKTPILDPHARGVIFGMTLFHNRYHLYRATLEGVVFGFRHHVEVLEERGQTIRRVVASEGGARSPLWRQIAADVLNKPVAYLADNPGAALAAAFVAGMGISAFQNWDDIDRFIQIEAITQPNPEAHEIYEAQFDLYREIYHNLKDSFRRIPTA